MKGLEITVNCLALDLQDFPSKRALADPRGTLLRPSSGGRGGHWIAGAGAGELGGGDLNCAPPRLQRRDNPRADQRLGASLAVPHLRGNPHESTGAGKVQCAAQRATARGALGARSDGLGAITACDPVEPNNRRRRAPSRLDWARGGSNHSSNCGIRRHPPGRVLELQGGQEVGELPGGAGDSVETDEQTRLASKSRRRGACRRMFHAAHRTLRLLIRPGNLRGRGSSMPREGGREGGRQPRRGHHRDGLDSYLRVLSFVDLFGTFRLSGVSQD